MVLGWLSYCNTILSSSTSRALNSSASEPHLVLFDGWAHLHELLIHGGGSFVVLHLVVAVAQEGQRRPVPGEVLRDNHIEMFGIESLQVGRLGIFNWLSTSDFYHKQLCC